MRKKIIYALILTLLVGLCGCSSGKEQKVPPAGPVGTVTQETKESITVVDQAGREVTVPKKIDSIALCYRVAVRFLLNLDQGDKIKGIGKTEDFLEELQPSLAEAADVGQGVADLEALAELKPDIFIHKASDIETLEAVEKLGIPAIGIQAENAEDITEVLDVLGKVCGRQDKAHMLIKEYNKRIRAAEKRAEGIKERKTAIVMGSSPGKVADSDMLQSHMIQLAGGINAAADLEEPGLWPTAGTEQLFQWDPDYIFITNSESAEYTVEDILEKPEWSQLKAVRNKNVYQLPAKKDSWEFPGVVSTLGIDYMMHVMYPKQMPDQKLKKNVDSLYQKMYGRTFSREELGY